MTAKFHTRVGKPASQRADYNRLPYAHDKEAWPMVPVLCTLFVLGVVLWVCLT